MTSEPDGIFEALIETARQVATFLYGAQSHDVLDRGDETDRLRLDLQRVEGLQGYLDSIRGILIAEHTGAAHALSGVVEKGRIEAYRQRLVASIQAIKEARWVPLTGGDDVKYNPGDGSVEATQHSVQSLTYRDMALQFLGLVSLIKPESIFFQTDDPYKLPSDRSDTRSTADGPTMQLAIRGSPSASKPPGPTRGALQTAEYRETSAAAPIAEQAGVKLSLKGMKAAFHQEMNRQNWKKTIDHC